MNPVMAERTAMVALRAVAACIATAMAVQTGQLELMEMMAATVWKVVHSAEILKSTVRAPTIEFVDGIKENEVRCRSCANATLLIAAELNPYIWYAAAAEVTR